ncbi:MAG: hypothetical protein AAF517_06910 [Planctomycetota bacterium]
MNDEHEPESELERQVTRYLDGVMDSGERREFERRVEESPEAKSILDESFEVDRLARAALRSSLPSEAPDVELRSVPLAPSVSLSSGGPETDSSTFSSLSFDVPDARRNSASRSRGVAMMAAALLLCGSLAWVAIEADFFGGGSLIDRGEVEVSTGVDSNVGSSGDGGPGLGDVDVDAEMGGSMVPVVDSSRDGEEIQSTQVMGLIDEEAGRLYLLQLERMRRRVPRVRPVDWDL